MTKEDRINRLYIEGNITSTERDELLSESSTTTKKADTILPRICDDDATDTIVKVGLGAMFFF